MPDKLRFAIVGLGMGRDRAEKCMHTEGAELVAVCDFWEERGRAAERDFGVEWVSDYEKLLARDDIDVVGLWTPSGMHSALAVQALETGKHVCMTKPMDIRLSACDAAIKAAEQRGLVLAVDFESRYNPVNHQIRIALEEGILGPLIFGDLRVKWFRSQDYYNGGHGKGWRRHRAMEGGSLANQAVHYLDLLQWWLGPVRRVVGKYGTFGHNIETEDASLSMMEFASGAMAMCLTTTCSFPDLGTELVITGTRGTLAWKDQEIVIFQAAQDPDVSGANDSTYVRPEFAPPPEAVTIRPQDYPVPEGLPAHIIEDMVAAVRDGKPVQCDGHEGRKTVAIIEAVYHSSDTGDWVALERRGA